MNKQQLAVLRNNYATIATIDVDSVSYGKLIAFLDRQPIGVLRTLAEARIKFVSALAVNRVNRLSSANRIAG